MKVNLQDKECLKQLRIRFAQAVEDYSMLQTDWSSAQKKRFAAVMEQIGEKAFLLVQQNVLIAGKEWDDYDETVDAIEPIDTALQENFMQLQIEVNQLVMDVARLRNEIPPSIASFVAEALQETVPTGPPNNENELPPPSMQICRVDDKGQLQSTMKDAATALHRLSRDLPQTVSQLQEMC